MDTHSFQALADRTAAGCWIWQGNINTAGYGQIRIGGTYVPAHRFSLHLHEGFDLDSPLIVCHRCDVRACVNPSHLFTGTHLDNARDRNQKGRSAIGIATPLARRVGTAKLTREQVRAIRQGGRSQREFARDFGVVRQTIQKVANGSSWKAVA